MLNVEVVRGNKYLQTCVGFLLILRRNDGLNTSTFDIPCSIFDILKRAAIFAAP
jgi:hypothetical protein